MRTGRDLVADDATEALADVAVDQQYDWYSGSDGVRQRRDDTRGDRMQPRVRRIAVPGEGEGERSRTLLDVGPAEALAHRIGHGGGIEHRRQIEGTGDHR